MTLKITHSSLIHVAADFASEPSALQEKNIKIQELAQSSLLSHSFFAHSEVGLRGASLAIEAAAASDGIAPVLHGMHEHFHQYSQPILENLKSFSENIDRIIKPLENICDELLLSIQSDLEVYKEKKKCLLRIIPITRRLIILVQNTAEQVLKIQSIGFDRVFEDYEEILSIIAFARVQEIDILKKQIQILQDKENHELQMLVDIYSVKMEEEAQKFDQLLNLTLVLDKEKEAMAFRKNKMQAKQRKEKVDLDHLSEQSQKEIQDFIQKMGVLMIEHESVHHKIDVTVRQNILKALYERMQLAK